MDRLIDPSADALWDSVAFIATSSGVEDRKPHTVEEWQALRASAVTLSEAVNLLMMPGRPVAGANAPAAGVGELNRQEIGQRMALMRPAFLQLARALQDEAAEAVAAIDARDPQRLMDVGSRIDAACEACHTTFWYPDQRRYGP